MAEDTTFGISATGLASLLGMALKEENPLEPNPAAGELLRACLAGPLPAEIVTSKSLSARQDNPDPKLASPGKPLGEALLAKTTGLDTIQRIKRHGKKMAGRSESGPEYSVGIAIYYAAIASALIHHNEKITRHSRGNLLRSFTTLKEKLWMPPDLSRHFSKASDLCK